MKNRFKQWMMAGLIGTLGATAAHASLVVGDYTNITSGTFAVSNTDLLQTNLSSASGEADAGARNGNFPANVSIMEASAANPATQWALGSTVTYLLNSKWSIGQINAYTQWDASRAEQGYTLQVTTNGGSTWTTIGTVSTPDVTGGNSASRTSTYDTTGAPVAIGVNGVRFANITSADALADVYREFDVIASNLQVGQAQFNAGNVAPSPIVAVSNDLLQTSLASVTGENAASLVRNGTTGTSAENTAGVNPAIVWGQTTTTYNLDVSTNLWGYDITDINVFSGWTDSRAGQSYEIWYSTIFSASFIKLGAVSELVSNGSLLTRTHNLDGTAFLSHIDAIRFVQVNNGNAGTGTVFREFDVIGVASVPAPMALPAGLAMLGLVMGLRRK